MAKIDIADIVEPIDIARFRSLMDLTEEFDGRWLKARLRCIIHRNHGVDLHAYNTRACMHPADSLHSSAFEFHELSIKIMDCH